MISINDILKNEDFKKYLSETNDKNKSMFDKILSNGIPFNNLSIVAGESQSARSIIDVYKNYLEYLKIENRDKKIDAIL